MSKALLAIEASLGPFSCGVFREGQVLAQETTQANAALERGMHAIASVLTAAKISPPDVLRIAVSLGPGSFTGMRIALSYAKALALGWGCEITGVSSFDILDYGVRAVPRATFITPKAGTSSLRIVAAGGADFHTAYNPVLVELLGGRFAKDELTLLNAPEDVVGALGERGIAVQSLAPVSSPLMALALMGAAAAPASSAHALVADYGQLAPAKEPATK